MLTVGRATVAAAAAGASLAALFNLAIRGSLRAVTAVTALTLASIAIFPLLYPSPDLGYVGEVLVGVLFTAVVISWGLFARAQRGSREQHARAG